MEKALRYELNKIQEIKDKIFPTNAPEGQKPPYLCYIKTYYNQLKTIEKIEKDIEGSYMLNILCSTYSQLQDLTKKVKELILTLPLRKIGTNKIYVEDLIINNITEQYEHELKLYRSIIDFKICYEEE